MNYYLYHIPGKKIGVTSNLNKRVTVDQGYKPKEYEVLFSSNDINFISDKEIELQKFYGYKIDRQKYSNLNKSNKMKVNITEQTTTFPVPKQDIEQWVSSNVDFSWTTSVGDFNVNDETKSWIIKNAKPSMYSKDRCFIYNKAYYEAFLNPDIPKDLFSNNNIEIFNNIRSWANERNIYDSGDIKTQVVKLYEEAGELSQAILKDNKADIVDAIGDCVVVLTNLAELADTTIEDCIHAAYSEISGRTGRIINGTFVKDEN